MHEMAITQSILNIALDEAAKHGARRVLQIRLKIGAYAGAVPQIVQEYFNIISADTAAAGAALLIETVPVTVRCRACGAQNAIARYKIACPACGGRDLQMLSGREFYVDSLEVE